jgi:uncharacterized peroxidase-related enzyme
LVQAVLEDWRTAPISEKLRAMLGFLEKLTLHPADIGHDDVKPLRTLGLTDKAIEDAIYVCAYFNIIDRVADALGFAVPPAEVFAASAASPATRSYALPPMG